MPPRKSFQQDLRAHHPRSNLFKSVVYQWGTTLHTHQNYSSFNRIQNYIAFKKIISCKITQLHCIDIYDIAEFCIGTERLNIGSFPLNFYFSSII